MTALSDHSVTVIGAGIGGLAASCYLADAGADVTVLERHDRPGGRTGRLEDGEFTFDTGPSWYLMPDVFERFFAHFDCEPEDYYSLTRLDPNYRVLFKDGDAVDIPADPDAVREVFESYETGAGATFDTYLDESKFVYEVGMDRFVYQDRPRFRDWVDTDVLRSLPAATLAKSMDDYVGDFFEHPKLRQLVQYTLVFLGGSPYNTPALYTLMSHVDYNLGVYYPDGGLYSVVEGLADLATELGVTLETGVDVTGIAPASSGGVELATTAGEHAADAVVSNAPPAHVDRDLLPDRHRAHDDDYWDSRTYAPSAYMLYLGVDGSLDSLAHHTLVLPTDWRSHFESIFDDPRWPTDPAYYVNVPSLTDDSVAPDGHEAVVVLVPIAPGLEDGEHVRERFREQVIDDIAAHTGVDLRDRIVVEHEASVRTFAKRYSTPQGTALGLAHTLTQTGPLRPGRRGPIDGLYYVGGSTTPGIGVPMCLISGEHAAEAVRSDLAGAPSLSSRLSLEW
ncbi:phytoene desaturase family protein [Salinibaculum rarum]|uniref:phytoene desaturase family protein n=1 Tax=Salinibaculum rarum TaxID=3058903 RepID=UPI00265F6278|nr:phytoene desaturase family protein [Salinibaculum sp. KK48]